MSKDAVLDRKLRALMLAKQLAHSMQHAMNYPSSRVVRLGRVAKLARVDQLVAHARDGAGCNKQNDFTYLEA